MISLKVGERFNDTAANEILTVLDVTIKFQPDGYKARITFRQESGGLLTLPMDGFVEYVRTFVFVPVQDNLPGDSDPRSESYH